MFLKRKSINVAYGMKEKNIPYRVYWNNDYLEKESGILNLGVEDEDKAVKVNLNKEPHILIAAPEGTGKTVICQSILWQLVRQGAIAYLIDLKYFDEYIPSHAKLGKVLKDIYSIDLLLQELINENNKRLSLLNKNKSKNIEEYNLKVNESEKLKRIVVLIEEIHYLLDKRFIKNKSDLETLKSIEINLIKLSMNSKFTSINLLIGTRIPDRMVLKKKLLKNIPVRICGKYLDSEELELFLGVKDVQNLPYIDGRFLFKLGNEIKEFQAYYFDEEKYL